MSLQTRTADPLAPAAEDALLASPRGVLVGRGVHTRVGAAQAGLAAAAHAVLAGAAADGHPDPVVVGALPFSITAPAQLVLPYEVERSGALDPGAAHARVAPGPWTTAPLPAEAAFAAAVEQALARIAGGALSKVVLARALDVTAAGPVDLAALLRNLVRADPAATAFAIALPTAGERRTLVGATPEQLVSRRGRTVTARPLAGSAARSADPAEDARRGAALLASAKDRHEHAIVVEAIDAALRPLCLRLDVPAEPVLTRTAAMWHLASPISGVLADPATTALDLAVALHPTPAVCGTPAAAARAAIAELEPADRGFYTGAVGWCDAAGDGEWSVAIRCGVVAGSTVRLQAGAGIVAGSEPAAEAAETAAKWGTLLRALGVPA